MKTFNQLKEGDPIFQYIPFMNGYAREEWTVESISIYKGDYLSVEIEHGLYFEMMYVPIQDLNSNITKGEMYAKVPDEDDDTMDDTITIYYATEPISEYE